jgi:hypothetical protein
MNLRCPECMSEVGPLESPAAHVRCENCGERFQRSEAIVSVADAEEYAEEKARCTCTSYRGCPQCFERGEELVGALVRDSDDREWRVLEVDDKDFFPIVCGAEDWCYVDELTVVEAAPDAAPGPGDAAGGAGSR